MLNYQRVSISMFVEQDRCNVYIWLIWFSCWRLEKAVQFEIWHSTCCMYWDASRNWVLTCPNYRNCKKCQCSAAEPWRWDPDCLPYAISILRCLQCVSARFEVLFQRHHPRQELTKLTSCLTPPVLLPRDKHETIGSDSQDASVHAITWHVQILANIRNY